jgi:threonylcarbamoyladenosine tRNA methylthiotransferase MtaB
MTRNPSVAFYTLGCKLNFSETSAIARQFEENGYQKKSFEDGADVYVINTCSVTDNADQKCGKLVRQALKKREDAKVVVIGCYAQLRPDEIAGMPGVDLVLGAREKFKVLDYINDLQEQPVTDKALVYASSIDEVDFYVDAYSYGDRTRTFLKVQDGCDYGCAFCTIPMARGNSRSDTVDNVVEQAENIAASEVREVVLTGVNIGDFGKGNSGGRKKQEQFIDLIRALDDVEGIERYRISSIEPNLLTNEIIEFVAQSKRFVPHFHVPLQSGSNKMLKKMRRRYLRELYADRVDAIKTHMPDCCIGVDVIVGFPGETEEDFLATYNFLNELDVSYLHVFTYSERPGTAAAGMCDPVPNEVRKDRTRMLRGLSAKKRRYFYDQHIGSQRQVLMESENKDGWLHGFTENYVKVRFPYDAALINQTRQVTLQQIADDGNVDIVMADEQIPA